MSTSSSPPNYADVVIADSPLLYTRLNDTSTSSPPANLGTSSATLSWVGASNPGFALNGPGFVPGGKSLILPGGIESGVVWTNGPNLISGCSLEAWFTPQVATETFGYIISKVSYYAVGQSDFPISLSYKMPESTVILRLATGNSWEVALTLSAPVTPGTPYYVVGTYTPNGLCCLYVNGVLVDSRNLTGSISHTNEYWRIGHANGYSEGAGRNGFKGNVAETAIYNTVLTGSQVAAHYAAGTL